MWSYLYLPGAMLTVDPLGGITTQSLGADYALAGQQQPDGGVTTFTRNANLQETGRQNALGATWSTLYDGAGNATGWQDPLGSVVSFTRDAFNNITSVQTMDGGIVTNVWGYGDSSFDTTGVKRRVPTHAVGLHRRSRRVRAMFGQWQHSDYCLNLVAFATSSDGSISAENRTNSVESPEAGR